MRLYGIKAPPKCDSHIRNKAFVKLVGDGPSTSPENVKVQKSVKDRLGPEVAPKAPKAGSSSRSNPSTSSSRSSKDDSASSKSGSERPSTSKRGSSDQADSDLMAKFLKYVQNGLTEDFIGNLGYFLLQV